jgi:hypothetical protein
VVSFPDGAGATTRHGAVASAAPLVYGDHWRIYDDRHYVGGDTQPASQTSIRGYDDRSHPSQARSGTPPGVLAAKGGAATVRLGQEGEAAVRGAYAIGPKTAIQINGGTRIPDGLTATRLSEVKNVARQSYTQQLKDDIAFARQSGR